MADPNRGGWEAHRDPEGGGPPPPTRWGVPPRFSLEMLVKPLKSPSEANNRPQGGTPTPPPRAGGQVTARMTRGQGGGGYPRPGKMGVPPHGRGWGVPPPLSSESRPGDDGYLWN
jgi:hypothetical protein